MINLDKTECRDTRCNETSAWLVRYGMSAMLLCPTHAVHATRRLTGARIIAPAADTNPSAELTASLAADCA
ncbi:hypothetical protein [Streptomyces sp. NBC_01304]|uniref:hypothetical protein n=1 Tax=Streptomyces sp. NBC_01304 TaxID=2903818 RepID=UPI002E110348|nr:hypothetical protein OG430_44555 [Streptomyces sp. NBC_01304]